MGLIDRIIGPDKFEIILDRIAEILTDELATQSQFTYDLETDAEVTIENGNPEDLSGLPVVNVSVSTGNYDNKDYRSVKGTYQYFIDCYANSKTTPTSDGGYLSAKKVHKLLRLCRAILNDPIYKTLGYEPGFIYRVYFSNFDIRGNNPKDALNSGMGRLILNVEVDESNKLIVPQLIESYRTRVNIGNTSQGYVYEGSNY